MTNLWLAPSQRNFLFFHLHMISLPYLVITLIYITGVSLLVTSVGRECIVYTCYYDNNQLFKNISLVWCCNDSNTLPPVYSFDCRLLTVRLCAALCLCRVLGAYWVLSSQSTWRLVLCGVRPHRSAPSTRTVTPVLRLLPSTFYRPDREIFTTASLYFIRVHSLSSLLRYHAHFLFCS